MTTTEQISILHKRIALLELGLKSLENRNMLLDKKLFFKGKYLKKIFSNYEKIQNLIELKKADLSLEIRDVNLRDIDLSNVSNQYECKYLVSSLGVNGII